jgi:hypothetical protein
MILFQWEGGRVVNGVEVARGERQLSVRESGGLYA